MYLTNLSNEELEQKILAEIRQVLEKYNVLEPEPPMARAKRKTNKKYR